MQRAGCKVAGSWSFRSQCSTPSLWSWRPAVFVPGAQRSCSDQQQMPMRKMRTRARRLRIGPTSRPSDLVRLLFSRPNVMRLRISRKLIRTVTGKAFFDIGHSLKDQRSNRRSHLPGYAAYEISSGDGLPWRGVHFFRAAHFNNRLSDTIECSQPLQRTSARNPRLCQSKHYPTPEWYAGCSRSHRAVIRVYDEAGNVI